MCLAARFGFAAALITSSAAVAAGDHESVERVTLRYGVAPGCPGEASFRDQVQLRTHRMSWVSEEPSRNFVVEVTANDSGYAGTIAIENLNGTTSTREVSGNACDEVVSALSLIAALAVDPNAVVVLPAGSPATIESSSPPARAPATPPIVVESARVAPPTSAAGGGATLDRSAPATAPFAPTRWRTAIGGGAAVASGIFPAAAVMGSVFVDVARPESGGVVHAYRLTLGATSRQSYDVDGGTVRYQWVVASVDACPFRLGLGTASELHACAFAEGGLLMADTIGFDHPEPRAYNGWAATGLLGRMQWAAGPWLLEGGLGPRWALTHPTYLVDLPQATRVHSVSTIGLSVAMAIGLRVP